MPAPKRPVRVSAEEWERRWRALSRFIRSHRKSASRGEWGNSLPRVVYLFRGGGLMAEEVLAEMTRLSRPVRRRKER